MSLSSNRIWEQKLKGICILFRMVYGTRSAHGIRYNGRVCETRHTMHTKHTIYYGRALKTCILCIPNIPYTTGGYAQICVPRVLSILHTMDAIGKQIVSPRPLRDAIRSNQRLVYGMRSTRSTWSSQGRWMGRRVQQIIIAKYWIPRTTGCTWKSPYYAF